MSFNQKSTIKNQKSSQNAWAFYDWANSVYPLVISTAIFPNFYESVTHRGDSDTVHFLGMQFKNSVLYSYTLSFSYLIIAFASPALSGIADYTSAKKRFMQFFCYLGAVSCLSLYFFSMDYLAAGLLCVMLASIGYSGSIVFYNAFLPSIAPRELHDRLSAKGYALGYFGSSLLLVFSLSMVLYPAFYGISDAGMAARFSFLLVGLWWIGFSQITFRNLHEPLIERINNNTESVIFKGFRELKKVWSQLSHTKRLPRFLLSFFLYNMGVQTVMLMATLFGSKELGMTTAQLIITILIIQFVAIGGAYLFSWISALTTNFIALGISIVIWIGVCIGAFWITGAEGFYIIGGLVGLVMGGIQSLSRSTYAKILPDTYDHASYFSFYDVCDKMGIVLGTFSYGYIEEFTGSMRNSLFALMCFFILGLLVLFTVPRKEEKIPA